MRYRKRFTLYKLVLKYPKLLLLALMGLALAMGWLSTSIRFQYDIESFFSKTDDSYQDYLRHLELFGSEFDFLLVAATSQSEFEYHHFQNVEKLRQSLDSCSEITSLLSITNYKEQVKAPVVGKVDVPIFRLETELEFRKSVENFSRESLPISDLISKDGKTLLLAAAVKQGMSKEENNRLLDFIERTIMDIGIGHFEIAGRIQTQRFYTEKMSSDMVLLVILALVLVVGFLLVLYRSLIGVALPLIALLFTILITFGIIALTGTKLDLILVTLPTFLFVIGVSNVVHLLGKYNKLRSNNIPKIEAVEQMLKRTGSATILTCLTTAFGFFALMLLDVKPVQRFGLFCGVGVLISCLVSLILVPSVLLITNAESGLLHAKHRVKWSNSVLVYVAHVIDGKWKTIRLMLVVGVVTFALAANKMNINNFFLDELPQDSDLRQSADFFERQFGGIRPFELQCRGKDGQSLLGSISRLKDIERIENKILEVYRVGLLATPLTVVKSTNKFLHGGKPEHYRIPESDSELANISRSIAKFGGRRIERLISTSGVYGRFTGKTEDLGSKSFMELNTMFMNWYDEQNFKHIDVKLTGGAFLMDKTNMSLSSSLMKGLILTFLLMWSVVWLMFRSTKLALLALICNVFPLLMVAGLMGLFAVDLKIGTSMIFMIAFGIGVDDSIHLLADFRAELKNTQSIGEAVKRSVHNTGSALIFTTIILCAGFLSLGLSGFSSTSFLGLLVSLTLLFALCFDLLVLPAMILKLWKPKNLN